jgi:hypothetical protein
MSLTIFLTIVTFLAGLYFYIKYTDPIYAEGLTNNNSELRCPNVLIQKGSRFHLYNSKLAKVPGVNPIEFENLEEYVEFLDWQRSQGIRCPVLYLQEIYDAQGNPSYKVRPSVTELQGGLPPNAPTYPNPTLLVDATRNDPPYNCDSYPAYDPTSFYVGSTTPLDKIDMNEELGSHSPNPMMSNWAGADYTQELVNRDFYIDREVYMAGH